jgi:hypothetical protein
MKCLTRGKDAFVLLQDNLRMGLHLRAGDENNMAMKGWKIEKYGV